MTNNNEITFDNADKFIYELDRHKWEGYYFRGQPDSEYSLIPSVWRNNQIIRNLYQNFISKNKSNRDELLNDVKSTCERSPIPLNADTILEWLYRINFENYLLAKFYTMANNAGIPISPTQLELVNRFSSEEWIKSPLMSQPILLSDSIAGYNCGSEVKTTSKPIKFELDLPQHYGIPTRLLDCTCDPRKAIFFAAYYCLSAPRETRDKISSIAVYAIKSSAQYIKNTNSFSRHENKFLHVQEGCFIDLACIYDGYYWQHSRWPSIEELNKEYAGINAGGLIELKKFTLSSSQVKNALDILNTRHNISISTMMPDYSHVAEEIKYNY